MATTTHPIRRKDASNFKSSHILVVDDDILTVKVVEKYLSDAGFSQVSNIADARDVIDTVGNTQPDMVLLDIFMPHVNGLEVLKQIRANKNWNHIIVLMLSSAGKEERYLALEMGAFGFIQKPVTGTTLIEEVAKAFRVASRFGAC